MPIASFTQPPQGSVRTGRRENPSIDGPRDRTVCFMLSEREKESVDRLAFCVNLTRSGLLANIVAPFVVATEGGKDGKAAEKGLVAYLAECRRAVVQRGALADKEMQQMKGNS
jgi:hypothetical protein